MLNEFPLLGSLLGAGIDLLHSESIEAELVTHPACTRQDLAAFNDEFEIELPDEFCQLYLETDGFTLQWEDGADWGSLVLPDLQELRLFRQRWVNGECPTEERFEHAPNIQSQAILAAASHWLPFEEEGNGDLLCIDCRTGAVVEANHDWGDADDVNGAIYASSSNHMHRGGRRVLNPKSTSLTPARRGGSLYSIANMTRMRFFNDELYVANRSHAAYAEYVSSLPDGLPDSILRINRGVLPDPFFTDPEHAIDLHDARIAAVTSTDRSLRLILKGDHNGVYSQITLDYSEVAVFVPIPAVLLRDVADSDLMCHETTVLDDVGFNHKMLFASSDILSIDFEHLIVHVAPV